MNKHSFGKPFDNGRVLKSVNLRWTDEFTYEFDELPVLQDLGFDFGAFAGEAVIRFENAHDWFVAAIRLDGSRYDRETRTHDRKKLTLDSDTHAPFYHIILDQLENNKAFSDHIEGEIEKIMNRASDKWWM